VSDELDPEVLADLQLRSRSSYDSTRTRTADYDWTKPVDVAQWKCRTQACAERIGVTQEAVDRLADANRVLARMKQPSVTVDEVMLCPTCYADTASKAARIQQAVRDRSAQIIRQLKASAKTITVETSKTTYTLSPDAAYSKLTEWGHPDVEGLRNAIRERLEGKAGKRKAGDL
jgi:hypothetical protein